MIERPTFDKKRAVEQNIFMAPPEEERIAESCVLNEHVGYDVLKVTTAKQATKCQANHGLVHKSSNTSLWGYAAVLVHGAFGAVVRRAVVDHTASAFNHPLMKALLVLWMDKVTRFQQPPRPRPPPKFAPGIPELAVLAE